MTREQLRAVIGLPLAVWGGLLLLLAANVGYAFLPGAPAKLAVALAVAAAMAALIVVLFMQLRAAPALVRLAAGVGVIWGSLLFLFPFADWLTR